MNTNKITQEKPNRCTVELVAIWSHNLQSHTKNRLEQHGGNQQNKVTPSVDKRKPILRSKNPYSFQLSGEKTNTPSGFLINQTAQPEDSSDSLCLDSNDSLHSESPSMTAESKAEPERGYQESLIQMNKMFKEVVLLLLGLKKNVCFSQCSHHL